MSQSGKPPRLPSSLHPLEFPITAGGNSVDQVIGAAIRNEAARLEAELKSGATISESVAGRWLREHSLTGLTGAFPEATINRLRNALADTWEAGGGPDQLVGAVRSVFADFSDQRAEVVAQTEVNTAYNVGRMATARETGMQEKSWSADGTDACEECQRRIAAGWIPIGEPFPGGVMAPCLHDGCDCSVDFRKTNWASSSAPYSVSEAKVSEVRSMVREGREEEAEPALLELVAATEQDVEIHGGRVAPWFYERLATIYKKRLDYASEIAILTRYCQQKGIKYEVPERIQKRLDKARGLLARANGRQATGSTRTTR